MMQHSSKSYDEVDVRESIDEKPLVASPQQLYAVDEDESDDAEESIESEEEEQTEEEIIAHYRAQELLQNQAREAMQRNYSNDNKANAVAGELKLLEDIDDVERWWESDRTHAVCWLVSSLVSDCRSST